MYRLKQKMIWMVGMLWWAMLAHGQGQLLKVATMNVDGLPAEVKALGITIPINTGGPGETFSPRIGEKIMEHDWDVWGWNEDFNYHEALLSTMSGYETSTYRGAFESSTRAALGILAGTWRFDIDGLLLGTKSPISFGHEDIVAWRADAVSGYLTNDQDSLTKKGFRYYQVHIDPQHTMDVIILHADAGVHQQDIMAREAAMDQLMSYIKKNTDPKHPLIVMGDFNCFYHRDRMKELFIDQLNAMEGCEARDVWVEYFYNGEFPPYGEPYEQYYLETMQMLDKIIYVNREEAPFRLELVEARNGIDFVKEDGSELADHYPMEATFSMEASTGISNVGINPSSHHRGVRKVRVDGHLEFIK